MSESTESKRYQSPLEGYPEYVKAIGMISIENASLESVLGELLGTLLGVHPHIGHTLYFTPRAAIARLELIENILPLSIATDEQLIKRIKTVVKRARAAIGKRHEIIHSLWAENELDDNAPVARISFPKGGGGDISIAELTDLIRDYRNLIEEIAPLHDEVQSVRGFGYRSLADLQGLHRP